MRTVPLILAGVAVAAGAWWLSTRDAPTPASKASAKAPATVAAPAPAPPTTAAPTMAPPRPNVPETAVAAPQTVPQLLLTVLARLAFPGEKPALTVMVGGFSATLREGDTFGDGFRLERIDTDRLVALHVATNTRIEKRFDELTGGGGAVAQAPVAPTPTTAPVAAAPSTPFVPPPSRPPAPPAGSVQPTFVPPAFTPQRSQAGSTVNDNPLVGAVLPSTPGKAPPGVEGPKPTPIRPGDPPPAGPKPQPIPPGTPGPIPR